MNKRGQFYLLAAIVIIVLITGFAAVSNYTQKQGSVKLFDIKEELDIEIEEVFETGTILNADIEDLIIDFTDKYQVHAGEDKNIYFIFGNTTEVWIIPYTRQITGTISGFGSQDAAINIEANVGAKPERLDIKGGAVKVEIEGFVYEFDLKLGENFFFVISQEVEGEQHIVTSQG